MDNLNNTFSINKYFAQGKSHIKNNIPCQDYCDYLIEDEFSIIALSDGAGSCKYSHFGSKLLVEKIILFFKDNYKTLFEKEIENIKENIIEYLSKNIEDMSKEKSIEEKELSATLLFVGCYKDKFIYGHIGDGIICYDIDGKLRVLSQGVGGEFKNETIFFKKNIDKKYFNLSIKSLKNVLSFYCFSDGLEPILISNKGDKLALLLQTFSLWIYKYDSDYVEKNLYHNLNEVVKDNHNIHDDLSLIIMNINNSETKKIREIKERITDIIVDKIEESSEELNNKLEEKISYLNKKIENLNNSMSNLVKDIENQNNEIYNFKKYFENQISNLASQNKNDINDLRKDIDELSSKQTPKKEIADLQKEVSSIKSYIQQDIDAFKKAYESIKQRADDTKNNLLNSQKKKIDNFSIFIPIFGLQILNLILLIIMLLSK